MTLIKFLDAACEAYYKGEPILSDAEFDDLAERVGYNKVGSNIPENKGKHLYRMFSLQKHYEDQGEPPLRSADHNNMCVTPKLDGAAISALYSNGKLLRVLTRGDGVLGVDITDKFLATDIIPHTINLHQTIQITGEICAPKLIKNARNYAAGSLNLKSIEEFKGKTISFIAYGLQPYNNETFRQDMALLEENGFTTIFTPELHNIYPCDGLVFRIDNYFSFVFQGETAQFPKGAYALKERQEAVETKIIDVEWQVGKSGKVTPVAILEPIEIGDAIVSRATLNNVSFIEELGIEIGDTVALVRSGEIIPRILHKVE